MTSRRRGRGVLTLLAVALVGIALAACGSSNGNSTKTTTGGGTSSNSAERAYFTAQVKRWYKGNFRAPSGPAVKAPTGKNVWLVSAGQAISASVLTKNAIQQAMQKLGWKLTVFDSQFDPTKMLTGVQQALAAKADGIILLYIDCSIVKNGLQQAQKAHVPVVGIESQDCSPSLEHPVTYVDHMGYRQLVEQYGRVQSDWVVVNTNFKAKTILTAQTDSATVRAGTVGNEQELKKCSTCEVADKVTFTGAEIGPPLQSKVQQALISHPEANSFIGGYDAIMTEGASAAIKSAGRLNSLKIMGGEGSIAGIQEIHQGTGMQACVGEDVRWEGYAAVDGLVRDFLGRNPNELDSGAGIQLCDKTHNLPPSGQPFTPPVNYVPVFYRLWGVG